MRDKFYVFLISVLLLAILFINFYHAKNTNVSNTKNGHVLSAYAIDSNDFLFSQASQTFPIKNTDYSDPDNINAAHFVALDASSAMILAENHADDPVPIASTTKIMTSIIVLENYNLEDTIVISAKAASQEGSIIGFYEGEKISVKNVLRALLINSGNDAAYALAEKMGVEAFVSKMNEKAIELGLKNTHFFDPAGLNDNGLSTAKELAVIARLALLKPEFRDIVKTVSDNVCSLDSSVCHELNNSNRLINPKEPLYYPDAIGVKTGFTYDAGHCLVSAASRNGHIVLTVVLNTFSNDNDASALESKKLLDWAYNNYHWN